MKISIGQAAEQTGKSKSTILRAIKSGLVSAERDGKTYLIDRSEMARVYGPARQMTQVTQPVTSGDASQDAAKIEALRAKLAESEQRAALAEARLEAVPDLRRTIEEQSRTIEDQRKRLDHAQLLLTDQRAKPYPAQDATRPSWWQGLRRLIGRE